MPECQVDTVTSVLNALPGVLTAATAAVAAIVAARRAGRAAVELPELRYEVRAEHEATRQTLNGLSERSHQ